MPALPGIQVSGPHILRAKSARCPLHQLQGKMHRGQEVFTVVQQTDEPLFPITITPCCSEAHAEELAKRTG